MNVSPGKLTAGVMAAVLAIATPVIAKYEGAQLSAYVDPVGVVTICSGHTGPDVYLGRVATPFECDALLQRDEAEAYKAVEQCVHAPVEVWQGAAMVSLAFNIGARSFCGSTLVKMVNAGAPPEVYCQQFTRWDKGRIIGVPVVLPGLTKRREHERQICLGKFRTITIEPKMDFSDVVWGVEWRNAA